MSAPTQVKVDPTLAALILTLRSAAIMVANACGAFLGIGKVVVEDKH
jgi:hypothetical protein